MVGAFLLGGLVTRVGERLIAAHDSARTEPLKRSGSEP
jgi:hypothetical protein